jgi:hypothetical protein
MCHQLEEIWELVQRRTVWYPMAFMYDESLALAI